MEKISSRLKQREEIESRFKWNLEEIYPTKESWEKDYTKVKEALVHLTASKGTLHASAEKLFFCLKKSDETVALLDKVYVYAKMKKDEDNTNPGPQALAEKAEMLITEVLSSLAFMTPEILAIPEETLSEYLQQHSELSLYKQHLDEMLRQKRHVLGEAEEQLLGMVHDISAAPKSIFGMYNNADIKFPFIKDEKGEKVELTKGRYIQFMEAKDRSVRKNAFKALYKTYATHKNTLAALLSSHVKTNKFYATARKYPSALQKSLDADNISTGVYDTLIDTVTRHLPLLHRYLALRKKALKLKTLHLYDLYVPLLEPSAKHVPYETALKMVAEGLTPLGKDYVGLLKHAFDSAWIDVYENAGKTSGAYSWGCYLSHPYVLLNYQGNLNDVFTLAHEMGHALHSYYTNTTQPYVYSDYKIFVAEVASTVNESLLTSHLLGQSNQAKDRAYILNHFMEEFRGTIFRQTMFAEFEKIIYGRMESGESLGCEVLCDIYLDLNKKYYGPEVVIDPEIAMEWARIPHFYNSFYVYKYATGMSCALSLSKQILEEGEGAVKRYLQFLKSGSSDYPLELLKKAGVDISTPKPIEDAFKIFEENLKQLEACL